MANKLQQLELRIRRCKRCRLYKHAACAVPGEGPSRAKIMFIGEAPGKEEDRTGRPFVGRAGKLLDKLFAELGIERKKMFITSVIKHRPPNNRDPKPDELNACKIWWQKQMEIIHPRLVVLLGRIAAEIVLKQAPRQGEARRSAKQSFKQIRGKLIKIGKITYLPTYHPAAALRSVKWRRVLKRDLLLITNNE